MNKMNKLPASSGLPEAVVAAGDQASLRSGSLRGGMSMADAPSFASVMQQQSAAVNAGAGAEATDAAVQFEKPRQANAGRDVAQGVVAELDVAELDVAFPPSSPQTPGLDPVAQSMASQDPAARTGVTWGASQESAVLPMVLSSRTVSETVALQRGDGGMALDVTQATRPAPGVAASSVDLAARLPGDDMQLLAPDLRPQRQVSSLGSAVMSVEETASADKLQPADQARTEAENVPPESFGMMAWLMGLPPEMRSPQRAADTSISLVSGRSGRLLDGEASASEVTQDMALQGPSRGLASSVVTQHSITPQGTAPWLTSAAVLPGSMQPAVEAGALEADGAELMVGKKTSSQLSQLAAERRQDDTLQASLKADADRDELGFALDTPDWQQTTALAGLTMSSPVSTSVSRSVVAKMEPDVGASLIGGLQNAPVGANIITPARTESATLATPFGHPNFTQALADQVSVWVSQGRATGEPVTAELHLNPAEMGPIQVKIAIDGQSATVDFAVAVVETRKVIEASLPTLSSALSDVGLNLTGGGVSSDANGRSFGQQSEQSGFSAAGSSSRLNAVQSAGDDGEASVMPAVTRMRAMRQGALDLYA